MKRKHTKGVRLIDLSALRGMIDGPTYIPCGGAILICSSC